MLCSPSLSLPAIAGRREGCRLLCPVIPSLYAAYRSWEGRGRWVCRHRYCSNLSAPKPTPGAGNNLAGQYSPFGLQFFFTEYHPAYIFSMLNNVIIDSDPVGRIAHILKMTEAFL